MTNVERRSVKSVMLSLALLAASVPILGYAQTSQKVIEDKVEYDAYISALETTDVTAKGRAMEAFVARYPGSVVKIDALEQAMAAYQQVNNPQKAEQVAGQILTLDANHVPALAILVFLENGRIKDATSGGKARTDAEKGLRLLPSWQRPEGRSDSEFQQMRNQMMGIFAGTAALGALQQQDYPAAQKHLEQALKIDPSGIVNNYQMAIALLQPNPINPLGFWYGAKALGIAQTQNPQAYAAWSPYFSAKYKAYHGEEEGWDAFVAKVKGQAVAPGVIEISKAVTPAPTRTQVPASSQQLPQSHEDLVRATALYKQACDGGKAEGCFNLGVMYANGSGGLEKDMLQAGILWEQACKGGYAEGCFNIGVMYEHGTSFLLKDVVRAAGLYKQGCDGGSAKSCNNLGIMYEDGEGGLAKDPARAAALYKQACDMRSAGGCEKLPGTKEHARP